MLDIIIFLLNFLTDYFPSVVNARDCMGKDTMCWRFLFSSQFTPTQSGSLCELGVTAWKRQKY